MSERVQGSYTIAANLRWFAAVYLIVLVVVVALAVVLERMGVSLPATGIGIGVFAGATAAAGQRFSARRDWTARDRDLLALGYMGVAAILSSLLAGGLLFADTTSLAIVTSGGVTIGVFVGAVIFAMLLYYAMARLMLMWIARRRDGDAWQKRLGGPNQ